MRLNECRRLCVKDVDFERRQIVVCDEKRGKHRVTRLLRKRSLAYPSLRAAQPAGVRGRRDRKPVFPGCRATALSTVDHWAPHRAALGLFLSGVRTAAIGPSSDIFGRTLYIPEPIFSDLIESRSRSVIWDFNFISSQGLWLASHLQCHN